VALLDSFWTSWPARAPFLPPDGEIVTAIPDAPGEPQSRLHNAAGDVVGFFVQDLLQVGREVVHGPRPTEISDERMFVPVYRVVDGVKRVVGFGWAEIGPGPTADSYLIVKRYSTVPVGGTSSSLVWPVDPLTEPVWSEILRANRELFSNDESTSAALAPGIARWPHETGPPWKPPPRSSSSVPTRCCAASSRTRSPACASGAWSRTSSRATGRASRPCATGGRRSCACSSIPIRRR
jgi:hypothetical protein